MSKGVDPAIQIALGLATGALSGFAQAKRQKKEDKREDERFALEKQLRESQMASSALQGKILQKEYDDAVAQGRVFTPEEKATIEESIALYKERGTKADTETKERDLSHYDEDRARESKKDALNERYMNAQIGAMDRSSRGGGSGGDTFSTGDSRMINGLKDAIRANRDANLKDDGSWTDKESYELDKRLSGRLIQLVSEGTGVPSSGSYGGGNSGTNESSMKAAAKKIQSGPPNPVQDIIDKPMAERSIGEQTSRVFGGLGNALKGIGNGVFRTVAPDLAASYVDAKTGAPIDPSGIPTVKLTQMVKAGIIRPMTSREIAAGVQNAPNPDEALGY